MIDKKPFEGHKRGPWWMEYQYVVNSDDETDLAVCTVGDWDTDRGSEAYATNQLILAAPTLLLENTKLCELVRAQQELIDWLDGGAMVGDFAIRSRVSELKKGLGLEE